MRRMGLAKRASTHLVPKESNHINARRPKNISHALSGRRTQINTAAVADSSRIRDVKSHLVRKHTPEEYCQFCQEIFVDDQSLQAHLIIGKCSRRDPAMLNGISHRQRSQLHKKSKRNATAEEQWFGIWEILFPGYKRPSTVYVDTELTRLMYGFREYCETQGPTIIAGLVESDPAWLSFNAEQRQILRRSIAQGIAVLFDDWQRNDSSISVSPDRRSNQNLQNLGTSTSSLVDSGVGMGGQSSTRDATSQTSEFPPTFGIPAAELNFQPVTAGTQGRYPSPVQEAPVPLNPTDIPTVASPSRGFVSGGQDWNLGDQIDGFETGLQAASTNEYDFDLSLASENMPSYFSRPGQDHWDEGPL
jgi:hypothetical protein